MIKKLGPVTYSLDVGREKAREIYINTLKKFEERIVDDGDGIQIITTVIRTQVI